MAIPLHESPSRRLFSEAVGRADGQIDLGRALLLIASFEYDRLDVDAYLGRLDALAESCAPRLAEARRPAEAAGELSRFLFVEQGFKGNSERYYDPRNSFLNEVLDRRTGVPITLSALYLEVARRCGVLAFGISFPGHFLVKVGEGSGSLVVDPFHGGMPLSVKDCEARLARVMGEGARLAPEMLVPCAPRHILFRTLRNLKGLYEREGDASRALRVADLALLVDPASAEDLKDRGRYYASLDCFSRAADDFEGYLRLSPHTPEAPLLRAHVALLRQNAARLN